MNPAYTIPLTDDDLKCLGELAVIVSQIDEELVQSVCRLLNVKRGSGTQIMGSTRSETNFSIWESIIKEREVDLDILWLVDHARKEYKDCNVAINDFVHAVYRERVGEGVYVISSSNEYAEISPIESEKMQLRKR